MATEFSQNQDVDPAYKNPYTNQFIVSVEHEPVENLGMSFRYVYKRGRDFPAWQDVRGAYEDAIYVDDQGAEATGQSIEVVRLVTTPGNRFFLQTNPSHMRSNTHAVTAQVRKRMTAGWQLLAAYTYLNSQGLLPSSFFSSWQNNSLAFSGFGKDPNDFVNSFGRLIADRPHTLKIQSVMELPRELTVAVNYLHQSGRHWARETRVPGLGFPVDPSVQMEPFGSRRLPAWDRLDLRIQKSFAIHAGTRLAVFVDLLNLLNDDAHQAVLTNLGTSEDLGSPSDFLLPRRLMLGAKLAF